MKPHELAPLKIVSRFFFSLPHPETLFFLSRKDLNCSSDCVMRLDGMGGFGDEGALILAATQRTLGDNPIFRINLPVCKHHQHKKKGRQVFADRGGMVTSAAR